MFVVVTDRKELDDQIYKTFASTSGVLTQQEVHAEDIKHLRQLLGEDHRYIFTLIQKFQTQGGEVHPELSERSDIIVITDEAHRSQYDTLALNMRTALPNAAFVAFTGTPLMVGEEKTKSVFGDYVSIYDFNQSIADSATVPLYYENRVPKLQLTNPDLNLDLEQILEDAELDEAEEVKLEREFRREYHLITRDERLETIAEDIVFHFVSRGYLRIGHKRIEIERLRRNINTKLTAMIRLNKNRMDYQAQFEQMINEYNEASVDPNQFFEDLLEFASQVNAEGDRAQTEELSEEELTVFDLLTHAGPELSRPERDEVKDATKKLLETLKEDKLGLDWRKRMQSRAEVRYAIETILDAELPGSYDGELFNQKSEAIYQHIYDSYYGEGKSIYTEN